MSRNNQILQGDEALAVLQRLTNDNLDLAEVINGLGTALLNLEGVGLRDGRDRKSRTYDLAFVRPRNPVSRQGTFATFITPTHTGKWNPPSPEGQLRVEARFNPKRPLPEVKWLKKKDFSAQGGGGWHCCCIDGQNPTVCELLAEMQMAFGSFP